MTNPKVPGMDFEAWGIDWPPPDDEVVPLQAVDGNAPEPDEGFQETEEPAPESPPSVAMLIEGLLFLGDRLVNFAMAGRVIPALEASVFEQAIGGLNRRYRAQNRPYWIRRRDDGYEMALLPRFGNIEERLRGEPRSMRIEGALLDTLAIVAFRQPVTRAAIEALKGSDAGGVLRQLTRLGLISQQSGSKGGYKTTPAFLRVFQIDRIEDLPRPVDLEGA
ncbi:MAG: SMC-Scp complex subunit ScpB [Planctomycetota bacterium]|nr:SMC-Scp complex subunit ScpB [Planctomycetota bacterium]